MVSQCFPEIGQCTPQQPEEQWPFLRPSAEPSKPHQAKHLNVIKNHPVWAEGRGAGRDGRGGLLVGDSHPHPPVPELCLQGPQSSRAPGCMGLRRPRNLHSSSPLSSDARRGAQWYLPAQPIFPSSAPPPPRPEQLPPRAGLVHGCVLNPAGWFPWTCA